MTQLLHGSDTRLAVGDTNTVLRLDREWDKVFNNSSNSHIRQIILVFVQFGTDKSSQGNSTIPCDVKRDTNVMSADRFIGHYPEMVVRITQVYFLAVTKFGRAALKCSIGASVLGQLNDNDVFKGGECKNKAEKYSG